MFITAYVGGATDKSVTLQGFTASTGLPYTAGAYNTAGITAKYRRHGANAEATITLATQTANGAHSDGGFVHVSGGTYRLDLPDAAIAASSDFVDIWVYGITDVVFTGAHVDILGADPRSATVSADMVSVSGDSAAADTLELFAEALDQATGQIDAGTLQSDTLTAAKVASDVGTEIGTAVWATAARTLTALDEDSTTIDLDAAIRAALGMASANLDTQIDALPTAAEITTALFARAFSAAYGSYTFDEMVKLIAAVLLGKASGLDTTTATYRNLADNANVVVATVDADGNRTAVTRTP